MTKKHWAVVLGMVLMVAAVGCSSSGPHGGADQTAIEANIRSQIATHYPGETFDISIEVSEDGVVTLAGDVNDNDKRTRIGTIAQETPGVTRVVNNITVRE